MKRNYLLVVMILLVLPVVYGQSFGKRLGNAAKRAAENTVQRKVERKVEKTVDDSFDAAFERERRERTERKKEAIDEVSEASDETQEETVVISGADKKKIAELSWNKFDFVAGDKILFEDAQVGEQLGEFPSMWDLVEGEAEIIQVDGINAICMKNNCRIRPLTKDIYSYLGDVFTLEFDFYYFLEKDNQKDNYGSFYLSLIPVTKDWEGYRIFGLSFFNYVNEWYWKGANEESKKRDFSYSWKTTTGENRSGSGKVLLEHSEWHHISISFNKRAMKIYVDQTRVANIPNMANDLGWLQLNYTGAASSYDGYIRNFRIAEGAVPLYDRMMTDGKIITYGITFDVGKSTIKPESMGELNRIVKLMKENPDLNFSVEGHTDNTGNAASNLFLSEARSDAVVNKLVEMGIAPKRLAARGKGQVSPIADNSTDEGRAKNRRVEFVKM